MPDYRNLNYVGSSGFGVGSGGRYGPLTTQAPRRNPNRVDYGIYDSSSGRVVSINTGQPFNGRDPMTGRTFERGVEVATPPPTMTPGDVAQRYQPVEVVRSPAVASATEDLMTQFRRNADSALEDFGAMTSQFRDDLSAARTQSREATDISPTVNALQTAQRVYSGDLGTSQQAYERALADAAARERAIVTQAQDFSGFDTALNNAMAQAAAAVRGNVSRYKMGTGTPTSMGSAENQLLTRGMTEAAVPIELARQQRRYDVLSGLAMPTEARIAGRDIAYAGGFLPSVAGSRYASETTLANTIQALKQQVAGMAYADAVSYLRAAGIPAELQNAILSSEAGTLGALSQLEEASRYRGLLDTQPVQVSQPVAYNMALPEYPNYTARYPNLGANAPRVVSPTTASANYGFTGLGADGLGVRYRGIVPEYGITPGYAGPVSYPVSYAHSTSNRNRYGPGHGRVMGPDGYVSESTAYL